MRLLQIPSSNCWRAVETPTDPNVAWLIKRNYLTTTHPNISFAVSMVSQFMSTPRLPHWEVVLRIVKYLKSHPRCSLFYQAGGHLRVEAFNDSDWVGGPSDRRSTAGYCVFLVDISSIGRVEEYEAKSGCKV